MTRLTQLLWIAAALAAPLTPIATAQAPTARRGFWGAFGLGYGANGLSCSGGCSFNSDAKGGGLTVALKLVCQHVPSLHRWAELMSRDWQTPHGRPLASLETKLAEVSEPEPAARG